MFCKRCGKEIMDDAVICPNCGCATKEATGASNLSAEPEQIKKANVLCIVGFVLSVVSLFLALFGTVAIVALVMSVVGIVQCNQKGEKLKGLGIAGLIVSIGSIVYTVYVLVISMALLY